LRWVDNKVIMYKLLGGITLVDKMDKNPSGKIVRTVYRDKTKQEAVTEV